MKNKLLRKIVSVFLCVALIMTYIPVIAMADSAEDNRISDPSTMDAWKDIFLGDILSTENAGTVWTDKSVFTDALAFANTGITLKEQDAFLVALSAIASSMSVTGMNNVPTDTMLVLDVSGSMNDNQGNNDVAEELVQAANESIEKLLDMNSYNRVGVVLYSGPRTQGGATSSSDAMLMLPLGRYTTGTDKKYLNYVLDRDNNETTESVTLDNDVRVEGTNTRPTRNTKEVVGGTYIQKGVMLAANQFTANGNSTVVSDPNAGEIKRTPIMVLMSDGSPTVGTTSFTNPGSINLGDGTATSAALGFVNQLTAAYAKSRIEEKYSTECLFYTLGLGVDRESVATSVLDPEKTSTAINDFWTRYNRASVNGTVTVQGSGNNAKRVTKISTALDKRYVDGYFEVRSTSSDMAQDLIDAFDRIVSTIKLKTKYYPTLISESEHLSGYVSFVDKVGEYMTVTDIKGILIHNTLFSGADLASNFADGANEMGIFGTPTETGREMINAVKVRLGLESDDEARTLIALAHEHGQISYKSSTEFSNYIGWYANAAGEFLGFWHEGIETMPDPDDASLTDATRPVYIVKSYGYLGEVDEEHGVSRSDMMYATVQVRENIKTGEQTVAFAVPAALIPIVVYDVTLDETGRLTNLSVSGAEHPIRLVYEVALDQDINSFNITEKLSDEYLADPHNVNADGSINFYTNRWDHHNTTGYGTVNTYSYFNPSRQNEKYYYLEDTLVYADDEGTLYSGSAQPTGEKYRAYTVYKKNGNSLFTETHYRRISDKTLATAARVENTDNWIIHKGNVHVNLEGMEVYKGGEKTYVPANNKTNTLQYANIPFVDTQNHEVDDLGYEFYVGYTHGNNGKLTVTPETGLKISKTLAEGATATREAFEFILVNKTLVNDASEYPAHVVLANGSEYDTAVNFANGRGIVALSPGDVIYIGGMTDDHVIQVYEKELADYIVSSVNGVAGVTGIEVTLESGVIKNADFVNADRSKGNLTVAKEINHSFGSEYNIPADKSFTITVTLTGIGTANATFRARQTNSNITSVTTDANGRLTLVLKHDEQFEIFELPEGTVATVVEEQPGSGFTPMYYDNTILGDGIVTVEADTTVSVIVVNDYAPAKVYPVNISVSGTKTLTGREWKSDDEFTFELQKLVGVDAWDVIGTATVSGTDAEKTFDFGRAFDSEEYTAAGIYYYRVVEIEPAAAIPGVRYDKTVHSFSVAVKDENMDGRLEIADVVAYREDTTHVTRPDASSWHVDVDFANSYSTSGNATVTVDLNKYIINNSNSPIVGLGGFTFGLYREEADGSLSLVTTSAATTDRGFARLVLTFEATGTYKYILKEIIPDPVPKGWTYDSKEIPVTVKVSDTGVGTIAAVIYEGDSEPENATNSISVSFTNVYQPKKAELEIDFADKELTGRDFTANDSFTFKAEQVDGIGNQVITGGSVADTDGDGVADIVFDGVLEFETVGTYLFDIYETSPDGNGITVDKTVYRIIVTVTDNGGELNASYVLINAVGDDIVFRNVYTAKEVKNSIKGNKTLVGRVLLNDEFTFILVETDENGDYDGEDIIDETRNFTDGSFSFDEITYTKAGTYYYAVYEKSDNANKYGIHYDNTVYFVKVEIVDNGIGQLEVESVEYFVNGDEKNVIAFENKYIPNPTTAEIPGEKTLEGKVLNGGDFDFELYKSDESWTFNEDNFKESVSNNEDGSFKFAPIELDKAGSYYYLVKEVNGGEKIDGIIYDGTVFRVRIEVTDDLVGQLHATVHVYDDNDIPQEGIQFINIYEISGNDTVTLEGNKTLENKDLEDGDFVFELYETDEGFAVTGDADKTATNEEGKFKFDLEFTHEDVGKTFYYAVKELHGGETIDRITYSDSVYHVTVTVDDDGRGGILTTTVIMLGNASVTSLDFTNVYTVKPDDIEINIEVNKTVDNIGTGVIGPDGFKFELENRDTLDKVYKTTDEEGKAVFTLHFTEDDIGKTFNYKLTEVKGDMANVTYSEQEYIISVTVELDENNRIVAYLAGETEALEKYEAEFVNIYDFTPEPPPEGGVKSEDALWLILLIGSGITAFAVTKKRKTAE